DALAALPRLVAPGRAAIVTLGGDGLVLQAAAAAPEFIAPHRVKVVSTHGAGDCFVGALAARLARGDGLSAAAQAANLAAARHVAAARG
ncbi:MAG: bifunctional hydroxymethylpyrimidine kinase/phosphomethylpyrimidine kinase, partial [Pseudomonadota bacterium]|nr:bifunctional hydroxymethylpyrimidine kinase/phosphomethylpyrimidine kinase [Pseudomonadota bacterium]